MITKKPLWEVSGVTRIQNGSWISFNCQQSLQEYQVPRVTEIQNGSCMNIVCYAAIVWRYKKLCTYRLRLFHSFWFQSMVNWMQSRKFEATAVLVLIFILSWLSSNCHLHLLWSKRVSVFSSLNLSWIISVMCFLVSVCKVESWQMMVGLLQIEMFMNGLDMMNNIKFIMALNPQCKNLINSQVMQNKVKLKGSINWAGSTIVWGKKTKQALDNNVTGFYTEYCTIIT